MSISEGWNPVVQQGVQRRTSICRVSDGAHDSIGWIGNEIAWFVFIDAHTLSLRPIIADRGYAEALPESSDTRHWLSRILPPSGGEAVSSDVGRGRAAVSVVVRTAEWIATRGCWSGSARRTQAGSRLLGTAEQLIRGCDVPGTRGADVRSRKSAHRRHAHTGGMVPCLSGHRHDTRSRIWDPEGSRA